MPAGTPVCLVRTARGVYALRDECNHESAPLSQGEVVDGILDRCAHLTSPPALPVPTGSRCDGPR
ncbi:MAG: Rieske (2Fe-2S) protein [Streptosporangiaceae bacterium]